MDHPLYTVFDVPLMYKHVIEKMVDKLQSILERKRLPIKYAEEFRAEVLRQLVEKKHLNHISVSKMRDSGLLDGLNINFEPDQLTRSKDQKITKQIAQPTKLFQAKTYVLNPHKRVRIMPFCIGNNQEEEYKRQLQLVIDTQVSPITDQEKEYHRQLEISKLGSGAAAQTSIQSSITKTSNARNILHRMPPSPIIIPDIRQHQQALQQPHHPNSTIYRHQLNQLMLHQQWQLAQVHYHRNYQQQYRQDQPKQQALTTKIQQEKQEESEQIEEQNKSADNSTEIEESQEKKHPTEASTRQPLQMVQPFIEQRCHLENQATFTQKEIDQTDGAESDDKVEFMSDDSENSFSSDDEPIERSVKSDKINNFEELSSDDDEIDDGIDHELIENCKNLILCQYEKIQRIKSKFKLNLMNGMMFIKGRDMLFRKATGEASLFASSLHHQD